MSEILPFQILCNFKVFGDEDYRSPSFTVMRKLQVHFWKIDPKKMDQLEINSLQAHINEDLKPYMLVCDVLHRLAPVQLVFHIRHLRMDMESVHPKFTRPWMDLEWTVIGGTPE